jgi:formylglycine-generating enzyme required for sulfatase activity
MSHDVFISHSSKDKNAADAVCAVLERNGIRCWIAPRDVLPGTPWGGAIVGAIQGAKIMVLVFSGAANASPQIEREVERAISRSVPVIPYRIEDIQPSDSLEYFISASHWLDAFTPPIEQHLERLATVVRRIIEAKEGKDEGRHAPGPVAAAPPIAPATPLTPSQQTPSASAPQPPPQASRRVSPLLLLVAAIGVLAAGVAAAVLFSQSDARRTSSGRPPGEVFRDCADCPEMVVVPAGRFMMGAADHEKSIFAQWIPWERPVHEVRFAKPFAVSIYPVTRDEYAEFVRQTNHPVDGGCHYWTTRETLDPTRSFRDPKFAGGPQGGDHPAVCVSHQEARKFASWLSERTGRRYRLLSDAEREYVARAGTTTAYWWGSSISPAQANYYSDAPRNMTLPVKSFQPNPWGLYQVHGNITEMVADCWRPDYVGAPTDGSVWKGAPDGDCKEITIRSGSFTNHPDLLRSAHRRNFPDIRENTVGFRVVRTLAD